EFRRRQRARKLSREPALALEMARRARTFALRLHRRFETAHVDLEPALARDVRREIDWKSIRVIEAKRIRARNPLRRFLRDLFEHFHALLERLAETLLLGAQCLLDRRTLRNELGI